jgi:hypothetical protein
LIGLETVRIIRGYEEICDTRTNSRSKVCPFCWRQNDAIIWVVRCDDYSEDCLFGIHPFLFTSSFVSHGSLHFFFISGGASLVAFFVKHGSPPPLDDDVLMQVVFEDLGSHTVFAYFDRQS